MNSVDYAACMDKYYIYAHSNDEYGVFYIGKGCGRRLYQTNNRSVFWKNIAQKYGYTVAILEESMEEDEAYQRECYWIKHHKDRGQCIANFTLGGDGVSVEHRWWNDKISEALKGRKAKTGAESYSYKDFADEDLLRQLYEKEGRSTVYIADLLSVSYTTVWSRLKQYGIKVRTIKERGEKIVCISTGETFDSITAAAKHYGVFRENIRKVLAGKYKATGGLTFKRVE
jgi:hypothetical protein